MKARDLVAPVAEDILQTATQIEAERCLPRALVDKLIDAGLFSIYTPRQFGGLFLPLPVALETVEEVARFDGSTGWIVAGGAANDTFTSALSEESAKRVLANGSAIMTSAPGFAMRAQPVEGGYMLSGQWQYGSAAPNADWHSVLSPIFDGDAPRMGEHGPEMVMLFMPADDVEIVDTWHVTGMRGTGSQDLRVDNRFVPIEMTGTVRLPEGPVALRETRFAKMPLISALGIIQAPPVCLGIARHALAEFREVALAKVGQMSTATLSETVQGQEGLARATALVRSARSYWYEQIRCLDSILTSGQPPSLSLLVDVRLASLTAAENSRAAVDLLYRLAGATSIFQATVLERCWRDVHTAAQHVQVQDGRWENAGRILFGLEPNSPFI